MDWRSSNFMLLDSDVVGNDMKPILENFRGFCETYKNYGQNTVSLTWFNPVDPQSGKILDHYGDEVPDYFRSLPTTELLQRLTDEAHKEGLKVIWKPQFILNNSSGRNVSAYFAGQDFPGNDFVASVDSFWKKLSPVADKSNVDLLVLGTENDDYAVGQYEAQWRKIISDVRSRFSGELTYDALGRKLINGLPLWV